MRDTTELRSSQKDYLPQRKNFTEHNESSAIRALIAGKGDIASQTPSSRAKYHDLNISALDSTQMSGIFYKSEALYHNTQTRLKKSAPPHPPRPVKPSVKGKGIQRPKDTSDILNLQSTTDPEPKTPRPYAGGITSGSMDQSMIPIKLDTIPSQRQHHKEIAKTTTYSSPAKTAAFQTRNSSEGFKNASKEELTNTPETSIDALVEELHKAFGTRRKQVEYHPPKSKRRAASTTSRAEGSPRTPSRVASAEAAGSPSTPARAASEESSRAPSRAESAAAGSSRAPSVATSAEAAASSRKAGSEAGEKEAARRLREENSAAKRAARLANNAQKGFDPRPGPRSKESVTSIKAGSSRAPSIVASVEAAASSRKAGSVSSIFSLPASSISSSELPSEKYGSTIYPDDSLSISGYELYGDPIRFKGCIPSSKYDFRDGYRFENDELDGKVDQIKRYKPNKSEEEAKEANIQNRIEAQKERLKLKAQRSVEEVEIKEAQERAEKRAERRETVKSLAGLYPRYTPNTIEGMNEQIKNWQQTHETALNKCEQTDKFLTKTKDEVSKAEENKQYWAKQIECLDREFQDFKQAIREAIGSTKSAPSASGTHEISGWCKKVSQGADSAAQEGDLSLIKRLEMRKESIEAGIDPSPVR